MTQLGNSEGHAFRLSSQGTLPKRAGISVGDTTQAQEQAVQEGGLSSAEIETTVTLANREAGHGAAQCTPKLLEED